VKTENYSALLQETDEKAYSADKIKEWEKICNECHPLTIATCITNCRVWKQKNEFRKLYEKMKNPKFLANLLNTLKNRRRLQILKILSKNRHSMDKLQQELKTLGYNHSQQTIAEEYVKPLTAVGLVEEDQQNYYLTALGHKMSELIENFFDAENALPAYSECYEETALGMLLDMSKTYKEFETVIPPKSVARVLSRLQKAKLVETTKENDYIFYFRTKRNPNIVKFSPTERKVYENIPMQGISAQKLAEKTHVSLRRTYKYLRRLRGKKAVFTRKKPKSYTLTTKGLQIAEVLKKIRNLALETLATASHVVNDHDPQRLLTLATSKTES
jgi:predicted transcriptional regulator